MLLAIKVGVQVFLHSYCLAVLLLGEIRFLLDLERMVELLSFVRKSM